MLIAVDRWYRVAVVCSSTRSRLRSSDVHLSSADSSWTRDTPVSPVAAARDLGVYLDDDVSTPWLMAAHVSDCVLCSVAADTQCPVLRDALMTLMIRALIIIIIKSYLHYLNY